MQGEQPLAEQGRHPGELATAGERGNAPGGRDDIGDGRGFGNSDGAAVEQGCVERAQRVIGEVVAGELVTHLLDEPRRKRERDDEPGFQLAVGEQVGGRLEAHRSALPCRGDAGVTTP